MTHHQYMQRCLELAQKAKGHTSPNPMVGAVLVHDGRIIGEGWHHYYGAAHAEVNCLDNVAPADRHLVPASTMYVNLEPCAHYGLTPPCATRLVEEKVRQVFIANKDPFERVSGRGIAILEEMGTTVVAGVLEKEGLWVNRRFLCYHTHKRPYIILKWAQTADGIIGAADKSSVQITGQESQAVSHKWRTEEAAIMVGYTTALNDNPKLTARHSRGRQPLRIAIDRALSLPPAHHLLNDAAPTWLINDKDETIMGNIHYVNLPFDNLLPALLTRLYNARILSVIIEGGSTLLNSFIDAGLWDEARIFTGSMCLEAGVAAPVLPADAEPIYDTTTGTDKLNVYTNRKSEYKYAQGMEL